MRELATAVKLTRRELRSGLRGFWVFLLCLILGVGAIAAVQSLSKGLMNALEQNGKYILGGDIALRTIYQPASDEQIKFLRQKIGPTTVIAETRAMARTADESRATLVELKAVDVFYPHYGTFDFWDKNGTLQKLSMNTSAGLLPDTLPNGDYGDNWGAYIEPELTESIGVTLGDSIFIGNQKFEIRGIIENEPDRLGSERFTYAPRVMVSRSAFSRTGLLQQGSQIYYDHKVILFGKKQYEELGAVQKRISDAFPDAKWKGRNYFNASPRIERFIIKLTQFLTLVGLTSLLVGGIGISNAVRSYLEQNYANIATFKCLGASKRLVFKIYFWRIMFFGLVGSAIGCLIGAVVPYALLPILAEQLSLTETSVSIYWPELALSLIFGLLTVALFSLYPLGRACEVRAADLFRSLITLTRTRPQKNILIGIAIVAQMLALLIILSGSDQRLSVGFIAGTIIIMTVFFLIAWLIKQVMKLFRKVKNPSVRFAISNLYRPGNNTNALVLSLGLGLTVFAAIGLIEYNFSQKLRDNISDKTPSFFFLDIQPSQINAFEYAINSIDSAENLRLTPQLRGRIVRVNGIDAQTALVNEEESWVLRGDRGFTWTTDLPDNSVITSGEWWPADYNGPPIVSISQDVATAFEIGVGDELTINILGFDITAKVANVREVNWGAFSMNFAVTFAPGALENAPATWLATVMLDKDDEMEAQTLIAKSFPNISAIRVRDALNLAAKILTSVAVAVRYAAALTLIAGMLVLAGALAAGQKRRLYDAVIFKVMGVRRKQIMGIYITEYIILGLIAAFAAAILGTGAAYAIQTGIMDLDWNFSLLALSYVIAIALVVSVLFGLAAVWRILQVKPAPYLRNE